METAKMIEDTLYRDMLDNLDCKGGEIDTRSMLAVYYASDRNKPAKERETEGGAYVEIVVDDDCAEPHLCANTTSATPEMLEAAAEFLEDFPLEYWEELARERWEREEREAEYERDWKDTMMRDYCDELRANWR